MPEMYNLKGVIRKNIKSNVMYVFRFKILRSVGYVLVSHLKYSCKIPLSPWYSCN